MSRLSTIVVVVIRIAIINGGAVWRCADGEG